MWQAVRAVTAFWCFRLRFDCVNVPVCSQLLHKRRCPSGRRNQIGHRIGRRVSHKAFITGLAGPELTADERLFLTETRPAGLILFARNCVEADQIRQLVADFRQAVGTSRVLVAIDQEGGRVQRLRPPLASMLPPAAAYAAIHADDPVEAVAAAWLVARLAADELVGFGINMNCAPVLDMPVPGAHDIIGNRAFGSDATRVIAIAGNFADGLMAGGIVPVIKHIPGHGRASADSHLELPVVNASREALLSNDLVPFRALAHLPAAMTAHVVYTSLDASAPASTSARVTADIIRGSAGFAGLLMSDDLGMKALSGPFGERARAVIAAGSDLALHCGGDLDEMREVAANVPHLVGAALARFEAALRVAEAPPEPYDAVAARRALEVLVSRIS